MANIFEALIPIAMFSMIFGIVFVYLNTRSKERQMLIEKNIDASLFFGDKKTNLTLWTLRIGSLLMGFSIGFLLGYFLAEHYNKEVLFFPPIFFFSGLFWVIEFFVERKITEKDKV